MTATLIAPLEEVAERERWQRIEREERRAAFTAIQSLDIAAWAREHLMISPEENDGRKEKYDPDLMPWHPPIWDAMGSLEVRKVIGVLPAQVGGKTTLMKGDAGARIQNRPGPIIWGVPRDTKDVKTWSKDRIDPMLRDVECLRALVSDDTRDKNNTIARKQFPGGYLAVVGMTQSADLQARPVAIIRIDELDQIKRDAGRQGSPLRQLSTRMKKFIHRNLAAFSTPTNEGDSPIMEEYETTDQGKWNVPCPLCKYMQVLRFGSKELRWGLKWNDGNPETAHYVCENCLQPFGEHHKRTMNAAGRFIADFPERTTDRGFWMNALVGMFDGSRWPILIKEFLEAKNSYLKLKQFINTVLCETFNDKTTKLEAHVMSGRLEKYAAEVPHGAAVLVRAVDTMDDRLEMGVFAFGAGRETWPIDYEYLPGNPSTPVPWRLLDKAREKVYRHASGRPLRPIVCFVDKLGHNSLHVDAWTKAHQYDAEPAFSIHGDGRENHPILGQPVWNKHTRQTTYAIGTWAAKYEILKRLNEILPPDGAMRELPTKDPGAPMKRQWVDPMRRVPGYFHLPDADWFTLEQLKQLTDGEKLIEEPMRGRLVKKWVVGYANHYLDLAVYALAGLYRLGPRVVLEQLGIMADALSGDWDGRELPPETGRRRRRVRSSGVQVT